MPKPVLSIGIIFKNEIRCLERCLTSLAPLRKAIPCEVVLADTGSTDGSREVAEKYADILIDFPWVDDFSAARNAVMDHCSGKWYLSLDADEWLAEDIKELLDFLRNGKSSAAYLIVRNYFNETVDDDYQDSILIRLLRMSTKIRFTGAIHEHWEFGPGTPVNRLSHTVLHHDGYIGLNDDRGKSKRLRNMALLKRELEKDPKNLRTILECLESSRPEPEHIEYVRMGIEGIDQHWDKWDWYGAAILRYAVFEADTKSLPELEEWIAKAKELFPKSFFTRVDVEGIAAIHSWQKKNYADCIKQCEEFLAALKEYRAGKGYRSDLVLSTLVLSVPDWERTIRGYLAKALLKEKKLEQALDTLETLDRGTVLDITKALQKLHTNTDEDTTPVLLRLFQRVNEDSAKAEELCLAFTQAATLAFSAERRKEEKERYVLRPSYSLYLPLVGKCEAGTAAAVMEAENVSEMEALLGKVEKWSDFPITALAEALKHGVSFPLPAMDLETMDALAIRLAGVDGAALAEVAVDKLDGRFRQLLWARSMVLAAVRNFNWKDIAQGQKLAQSFVKMENVFLPRCYMPEVLCEEYILLLPPIHRFGWYCGRALQALEAGDASSYARLLREGLKVCPEMKPMAEFLAEYTPQLQIPSKELTELADKVRGMLANFAPDDPAVAVLKQSPVYQKVAYLIEGIAAPVVGGLPQ